MECDKCFEVGIFIYIYIYIYNLWNQILGQFEMSKQALLYYVHRNMPMVPFLYIIIFILFFQIILDNINIIIKINIWKPKHQNLNSKLNGLHFVEFIKNIPLVMDGKMPQMESL